MIILSIYLLIASLYYYHNRHLGGVGSGIFVALLWFIVAVFWVVGYYLMWNENREIGKLL